MAHKPVVIVGHEGRTLILWERISNSTPRIEKIFDREIFETKYVQRFLKIF